MLQQKHPGSLLRTSSLTNSLPEILQRKPRQNCMRKDHFLSFAQQAFKQLHTKNNEAGKFHYCFTRQAFKHSPLNERFLKTEFRFYSILFIPQTINLQKTAG